MSNRNEQWDGLDRRDQPGDELREWTAKIVIGALAQPRADITDVPGLIVQVHSALAALGSSVPAASKPPKVPKLAKGADRAVSIMDPEEAITHEHITCLICGKQAQILKSHLRNHHKLSPEQYRKMFTLRSDYPIVSDGFREMASARAKVVAAKRGPEAMARLREKRFNKAIEAREGESGRPKQAIAG